MTTTLSADLDLGPTVYGHRRKGDCSEIETVVMPGSDTRSAASKSRDPAPVTRATNSQAAT
ncbi:MAG: hypothetical protein GY767_03335 [Shimia sp.]|nr:hypothetical protein [Shimia sp.]